MSFVSSFEFRTCRCRKIRIGEKNLQLKYLSLGQEGLGGWVLSLGQEGLGKKKLAAQVLEFRPESHGALTSFRRGLASDGDSILYSC
jgi:hypothetical protein